MKKQFSAFFLALLLCLGLAVPAFAADADEVTPVTENDITLSNVIITDQYKKFSDEPEAPKGCYNLGMIRLAEDAEHPEYRTVGIYIVPDDAVITFHLSQGHTGAEVYAVTIEEDEPQNGVKAYTVHTSGSISTSSAVMAKTVTIDKKIVDTRSSKWDTPTYDLLACRVKNGQYVWVMFESKTDALGEPLPAEPTEPAEPAEPAVPAFTDVPAWCADAVSWAARNGVTTGATPTTFAPGKDCTREQILTFLWRALGEPEASVKVSAEVAPSYAGAADWAYEKGLVDSGFSGNTAPCTRSEAVYDIWRAQGEPEAAEPAGFSDVEAGSPYAAAISWAVENGIAEGYPDGTFRPDTVCSRGVIVTLLHRAFVEEARLTAK